MLQLQIRNFINWKGGYEDIVFIEYVVKGRQKDNTGNSDVVDEEECLGINEKQTNLE